MLDHALTTMVLNANCSRFASTMPETQRAYSKGKRVFSKHLQICDCGIRVQGSTVAMNKTDNWESVSPILLRGCQQMLENIRNASHLLSEF